MVTYNTPGYSSPAAAKATSSAARARLAALNQGPADVAQRNAVNQLIAAGKSPYGVVPNATYKGSLTPGAPITKNPIRVMDTNAVRGQQMSNIDFLTQQLSNQHPAAPVYTGGSTASSGGGGRSSGGGGGAAATPQMSQAMIDWIASLLKSGAPETEQFNAIDLPDYVAQPYRDFDPTMYNQLRASLTEATQQDQATIDKSRQDMLAFLGTNYRNAFANTDVSGGPQMGATPADMARLAANQGVTSNPQYAGVQAEGQRAQQMAGDWRQAMASNEDIMQRARIGGANTTADQNGLALRALSRQGQVGVGLQESQARTAWQQAADAWNAHERELAYNSQVQESMANWQRQNQVQDLNTQSAGSYRNQTLQALLDLAGKNVGNSGVTLPSLQALGLAPAPQLGPRPAETAEDPLHWAQIDWDLRSQGLR